MLKILYNKALYKICNCVNWHNRMYLIFFFLFRVWKSAHRHCIIITIARISMENVITVSCLYRYAETIYRFKKSPLRTTSTRLSHNIGICAQPKRMHSLWHVKNTFYLFALGVGIRMILFAEKKLALGSFLHIRLALPTICSSKLKNSYCKEIVKTW